MSLPAEIGPADFAAARAADRARLRAERAAMKAAASAARDAFIDEAAALYASGGTAAPADADVLEDVAERALAFVRALEPLLGGLAVARDQAFWRGPVLHRIRSRYDEARLAELVGEVIAQEMLSETAAALLSAAIRVGAA